MVQALTAMMTHSQDDEEEVCYCHDIPESYVDGDYAQPVLCNYCERNWIIDEHQEDWL